MERPGVYAIVGHMLRTTIFVGLFVAVSFGASSIASACTPVVTVHSTSAKEEEARRAVEHATAIIDGEVIQPLTRGVQNAQVRAHRVLRGPVVEMFEVGEETSCDIALTTEGQRSRMLLVGGPEVYFLRVDQSNAELEDRLLGSDRSVDWPYRDGH